MNNLVKRWKAESPVFFKNLKKGALAVGGSAAAVIVANSSMSLNLNATLIQIVGYIVAICAAIAGTAQLTKNN